MSLAPNPKIVYISGPYRNLDPLQQLRNVIAAWEIAREVWRMGHIAVCPHANSFEMDEDLSENFIEGDCHMISRCVDIVYMLRGWTSSEGAIRERNHAQKMEGMVIVYSCLHTLKSVLDDPEAVIAETTRSGCCDGTTGMSVGPGVPDLETFPSGAKRTSEVGRGRYDLISPLFLKRLALQLEKGAIHPDIGARNWEKGIGTDDGIPLERFISSKQRHAAQHAAGETDEDHLGAEAFNLMVETHIDELNKRRQ